MANRQINTKLRRANKELRDFMKENNMMFHMTLQTFLTMVTIWADDSAP